MLEQNQSHRILAEFKIALESIQGGGIETQLFWFIPLQVLVFRMKTFTLEEAQSLLPLLESLLKRAMDGKRAAEEIETQIAELGRRIYLAGGMRVNVAEAGKRHAELQANLERVRESLAEIDAIGVQVKDVETGLLDFPCRVDEQVVLLCWRMGEAAIEHWHTVEDGFKGRRPLDERFRRRSNSSNRPN